MKIRNYVPVLLLLVVMIMMSGCGQGSDQPAKTVEAYLQALVAQDGAKLSNLSCKDWEKKAILEMDSFQAVSASLEGMACKQSGSEAGEAMVVCEGKIVATYNDEKQELDLSLRTYRVSQEGGDWRVCGYR